ncbi:MAG: plasmid mobilization protein [Planctomycetota bacterium]
MGRPFVVEGKPRKARINIRLSQEEYDKIEAEADRLGISVTDLLLRPWRKLPKKEE